MENKLITLETGLFANSKGFFYYSCLLDKWMRNSIPRCEKYILRDWLREKHDIHITITPDAFVGVDKRTVVYNGRIRAGEYLDNRGYIGKELNYNTCLEKCLIKGLNLIK